MKMEGHSNLTGTKTLEIIIALLINLVIFSTNNKLMMYTKHLSLFIIVLCFVLFVSKKDYTVKMPANCFDYYYPVGFKYKSSGFFLYGQ